jgi:plastocyanin
MRIALILTSVAILTIGGAFAVSCGGDDDSTGGDLDSLESPAAGGGETSRLEISADNSESFDKDKLEANAGQVEITFNNEDDGVIHNFALFESADDLSEPIGATQLLPGPSTETITVQLSPGEYFYHCDSHPEMQGTLEVSD